MNIDDLSWQARHHGGVYPRMVRTLLDLGQVELLVRAARERGDWNCAEAAARELCEAGECDRALALVAPFAEIGWRPAEWATAEIMIHQGEGDEALATVRPDATELGDGHVCARYAELLSKAGRIEEAIDVLKPHLGEHWLRSRLVEVTERQGCDDRVLDVLTREAERMERTESAACERCGQKSCGVARTDRWDVLLLISRVLERAGRMDEAVEVLRAERASGRRHPVNFPEYYAELLARQGLIEELGVLAAEDHRSALDVYAKALEDAGRPGEAETVLREGIEAHDHPKDRAALMRLLVRQGRVDEAVETGRPTYEYYDCWNFLPWALELLVDDGRPGRALELLDGLTDEYVKEHPDQVRHLRLWLLGEADRCKEGISEATALNEREPGEWDTALARLLERDGQTEEALALLRSSTHYLVHHDLPDMLIRHGRPAEALDAIPTIAESRAAAERREREREQEAAERREQDDPWAATGAFGVEPRF
ncbi:tetratricopeptide repeat protein [Kitasatospora sp. RG8]|uniref:tetratricopeptide repeat protein n=1 Tax=Kitasatospora sp. RG8 TaxID=2820815 RepID=UPI001ADF8A90|nr:tetratricopeptide repeat protein [Kitasatospora sp. RG8]MBP0451231.1 tetratricopeptide repeat protein [Kitasatospora sp. RG8]